MSEALFTSDNIVHIGAMLYLAGFLFRNQLILRGLIIAGDFVYILYFYFAPDVPLWGGIFWSVMFTVVNLAMMGSIAADTMHFNSRQMRKNCLPCWRADAWRVRGFSARARKNRRQFPPSSRRQGQALERLYFILKAP